MWLFLQVMSNGRLGTVYVAVLTGNE
jgi:hypothetical protein